MKSRAQVFESRSIKGIDHMASHSNNDKGLAWLIERKRLLEMELAFVEGRGMALPLEKQPCTASTAATWSVGTTRPSLALVGRGPEASLRPRVWRALTLRWWSSR